MACLIARTMEVVGEPWSPLIIRNIYIGITRFDQLQQSLSMSRKVPPRSGLCRCAAEHIASAKPSRGRRPFWPA